MTDAAHIRSPWWRIAPIALAVLLAALLLPVIFFGNDSTSEASDEAVAHLPAIKQFAQEWPTPNLRDYPSATAPGYHLLMAIPARMGVEIHGLRIIGSLAGLALLLLVWRVAARAVGPGVAFALTLPLALSTYVLSGCAWLTTDVLSVLLGSAVIATAAWSVPTMATFVSLGVFFTAALLVRQTNVALIAPILAAGVFASPLGRSASNAEQWQGDEPRSWWKLFAALAVLLPGALLLMTLISLWGGLIPPAFRSLHERGLNPVAPIVGLSLVGVWGSIALLPAAPEVLHCIRRHRLLFLLMTGCAAIAAAIPESSLSQEEGRWGGAIWRAVQVFPTWHGRSLLIVGGAVLGSVLLTALWLRAAEIRRGRQASVVMISLLALFLVQIGNSQVWERYFDPAILVALAWLISLGIDRTRPHSASRGVLGACLLAVAQGAISAINYWLPAFSG